MALTILRRVRKDEADASAPLHPIRMRLRTGNRWRPGKTEYGRPLEWEAPPNAGACRIAEYREDADVTFEDRYDEFIDWFLDAGARLRRALSAVEPPIA